MSEHARLSPSGAKRWMACPGSLVLEAEFPNTSSEASNRGTAMHTVAAQCFELDHYDASPFVDSHVVFSTPIGEPSYSYRFDAQMAEEVSGYVGTVRALAQDYPLFVEHRVDFSEYVGVPESFGTADAIILIPASDTWNKYELFVIDLKTGWVGVSPENNPQLMLYALGAYAEFSMSYDIRAIRLGIYQPASGGLSEWTCTVDELMAFAEKARSGASMVEGAVAMKTVFLQQDWERTYLHQNPNEDDCRFCRAMATCPAMAAKVQESVGAAFSEIVEEVPIPLRDELSDLKLTVPTVRAWCDAVDAEVTRRLLAGQAVGDFGLELGREGSRKWADPEAVEQTLRKTFRLKIEDTFDMTLKSPTTFEKQMKDSEPLLTKKQWEKLQALINRAPAKPVVKRLADIKTPYAPEGLNGDAFSALEE